MSTWHNPRPKRWHSQGIFGMYVISAWNSSIVNFDDGRLNWSLGSHPRYWGGPTKTAIIFGSIYPYFTPSALKRLSEKDVILLSLARYIFIANVLGTKTIVPIYYGMGEGLSEFLESGFDFYVLKGALASRIHPCVNWYRLRRLARINPFVAQRYSWTSGKIHPDPLSFFAIENFFTRIVDKGQI